MQLIQETSLLGVTDTWSTNRKACGRAMGKLLAEKATVEQVDEYSGRLLGLIDENTSSVNGCETNTWKAVEGAWIGLSAVMTKVVPIIHCPTHNFEFGRHKLSSPPSNLTPATYIPRFFQSLESPQPLVRDAALDFFKSGLKRINNLTSCDAEFSALTARLFDALKANEVSFAAKSGLLEALSLATPYILKTSRSVQANNLYPSFELKCFFDVALPSLESPASTVRQKAAVLLCDVAATDERKCVKVIEELVKGNISVTTTTFSSASWQGVEGRLLACDAILEKLLNDFLINLVPSKSSDHLHALFESPELRPRFLRALTAVFSHVATAFPNPRFEVRRIAAMVLPQIAKIMIWLDPCTISKSLASSSEILSAVFRAAVAHVRHVAESMPSSVITTGSEKFGSSHQGIADSEAAQTAATAVVGAAKNENRCIQMVASVLATCSVDWLMKVQSMVNESIASKRIGISEIEVLILLSAFLGTTKIRNTSSSSLSDSAALLCASQICVIHSIAYGKHFAVCEGDLVPSKSMGDVDVFLPTNISKESLSESEAETTTPQRAVSADRALLASVLKFVPSFCVSLETPAACRVWSRILLTWICQQEQPVHANWGGTAMMTIDVYARLLNALGGVIIRGDDAGLATVAVTELSCALRDKKFGSVIPANVLRALLDLLGGAFKIGGDISESALPLKTAIGITTPPAHSGGTLLDKFKNMKVATGIDDVVEPLPATPEKTPKVYGEAHQPPLPPTPAAGDNADTNWDDWDDIEEENDVDENADLANIVKAWLEQQEDAIRHIFKKIQF